MSIVIRRRLFQEEIWWSNGLLQVFAIGQRSFDIEEGCVIYHTAAKHSHFCREDEWMLVRYFELVEDWLPKDAIIFRDEGKAYDTCFSKIQASAGIDKVIVYPPAVHELLSPNDNKVHGIAKERWRRCDFYKKDAVESSLSLLHFLRNVDGESISTFFTENFFYNSRTSFTKAEVEKVVMTSGKRRYERINFFRGLLDCISRFVEVFVNAYVTNRHPQNSKSAKYFVIGCNGKV